MPSNDDGRWFEFEGFTFDLVQGCLRAGDQAIELRPKSFDVLRCLLENAGRLVSKDELVKTVWPGIFVEDDALTHCVSEIRSALGDRDRRIIKTVPRRGYLFFPPVSVRAMDGGPAVLPRVVPSFSPDHVKAPSAVSDLHAVPDDGAPVLALPEKPSIAVLPFTNMSDDPGQEYFADGVTDEIITALSRFRSLFVIARNSTFAYKGKAADVRTIGRELGVRYVLAGSIRRAGSRTRIIGQLSQADSGVHIWAERYDGDLADIFELQDRVASDVVGAIVPKLEWTEIQRAIRKPTSSGDAYDTYLRGMAKFYQWTREGAEEARPLLRHAIALDPGFAAAHAMAAHLHAHSKSLGVTLAAAQVVENTELARRAVDLGRDDAFVLSLAGWSFAYVGRDLSAGAELVDQAVVFNPNLAMARFANGWLKVWAGKPDVAIAHLAHALRLSPIDPYLIGAVAIATAHAHFMAERYGEALSWADKAMHERQSPAAVRIAAASAAVAGRRDEAKRFVELMGQVDPTRRLSNLEEALGPYRRLEDLDRYKEALRLAGLPE